MTHGNSNIGGGHGEHAMEAVPSWQSLFSSGQWEMLQAADRQAARNIVCLMTGIFILGLIGYLGVCFWVA
jgi:hypothetical protein